MRRLEKVIHCTAITFAGVVIILATCSIAHAGVMEMVRTVTAAPSFLIGIGTLALLYALKRIPNEQIAVLVHGIFKGIGTTITLGLGKYKWSAPVWNSVVEPYFIDLLRNTVQAAVDGLIAGVRSDNEG